tara:strand:+ start:633 stop:851 length:219 start_codon:yes stop_codon:yes gene_type:complete
VENDSNKDDKTELLADMVLMKETELNELESDLEYWHLTVARLSELLTKNAIEHEISEESLAEWLQTQDRNLQ